MKSLRTRQRTPEWMDFPDADPDQLARSLAFLRKINTLLGYTRTTIAHLHRFSRRWRLGEQITIVDFATGSADVPRAILRWADRCRFNVRITGIDLHSRTAREARRHVPDPRLAIIRADVLDLPFAPNSFDYAITSLFLHHLSDGDAVRVLQQMDRVARRGIIAADLVRNRRAYGWIYLFTLFANPMVRHDARVSVAQAFTPAEAEILRDRANLPYLRYTRHLAHRFTLAGEKI
jgi:ubiquinone/menaquinone biosynthesis C-methylase UbiE